MPSARPLVLAVLGCAAAAAMLGAPPARAQQQQAEKAQPQPQPQPQPEQGPRAELLDLFDDVIVPQLPVEQVIRFAWRGDDLALESDLGLMFGVRQVRLRGLEGIAQVQVGRRPRGPMGPVPTFELVYTGPAAPGGEGSVQTTVSASAGRLRIQRAHRLEDLHTHVGLIQEPAIRRGRPPVARERRVTLTVKVVTPTNEVVDELRASAGSFAELMRQHPGPAAKYLAPAFRELGQEAAVFGVETEVAWQLFPDAVDADEALASRVLAVLDRFNDRDFAVREAAAAELDAIGGPAVIVIGELDRAPLTAEQNTRIDAFLANYRRLAPAEVEALLADPEFLLRCFTYCDEPPARAAAAARLATITGLDVDALDPAAGLPARVAATATIRDELAKAAK